MGHLKLFATLAVLTTPAFAHAQTADPLFQRMLGHWTGSGASTQLSSGRRVALETEVDAALDGDRLVSKNTLRETADNGATRTYVKVYWLQNAGDQPGHYILGTGSEANAEGVYAQNELDVVQTLGGEPPLKLESFTRFEGSTTSYRGQMRQGNRLITLTTIKYRKDNTR